jgi:hypothetical protein
MPTTASIVTVENRDKPTVPQVYALAAELCERSPKRSEGTLLCPLTVHSLA